MKRLDASYLDGRCQLEVAMRSPHWRLARRLALDQELSRHGQHVLHNKRSLDQQVPAWHKTRTHNHHDHTPMKANETQITDKWNHHGCCTGFCDVVEGAQP